MSYRIINGDSAKELKKFKDNSIDAVITDPPYGIEFLAKDWDSNTGAVEIWQECLRVLKPGGFLLAFSAPRTYHILATNIQSAGFEIKDQVMWLYSMGFPKAQQVKGHKGWKTALKPAHEPICMARKPMKGTTYKNMDKHGIGALNIDATRIGERFPSNVIGEVNGYQKYFYAPKVSRQERNIGCTDPGPQFQVPHGFDYRMPSKHNADPKALVKEVEKTAPITSNNHPTVKPVALMKYLIKLVAPQGSHILDPFAGSGSTGMACKELGMKFTGIEMDANYVDICIRRIEATKADQFEKLFDKQ